VIRRTFLLGLAFALTLAASPPVAGDAERARVRGTLVSADTSETAADHDAAEHAGDSFAFVSPDGERFRATVEGDNWHILSDPALSDRLWELEGSWIEDGLFTAKKIFTVKDSGLHQVTYYCEICNIVSYRPGRCMCCQDPVELREIPAETE